MRRAVAALASPASAWRLALVLAAGAALAAEVSGSGDAPLRGDPPVVAQIPDAAPAVASVRSDHPAVAERPLFHPSRRPWMPPAAPPPDAAVAPVPPPMPLPPPSGYTLVGVVVSGPTRSALLRAPGGGGAINVVEGQALDGWILREISPECLRFEAQGAEHDLRFPPPTAR